jgi:uncharacterized membrane protein/thiol-disulfide isomerase/thioredoxin
MLLNSIVLLLSLALLIFLAGRGFFFGSRPSDDVSDGLTRFLVTLLRLTLFAAIAASAVLVVDYQNAGDPAFCGVTSGCFAVRVSPYSRVLGVPLPNLGLSAFAALLAATLLAREPSHHRAIAAASVAGGAIATVLLAVQAFAIGAFCAWCLAVDVSAIVAAAVSVLLAWRARRVPRDAFARAAQGRLPLTLVWGVAALLAIGLPFVWGRYPVVAPLPPDITALQVPGRVTVVGFTDFQCPFCRKLHPEMHKLEERYGDRLHLVRKMMPLSGHAGAMPAAKAYLCTPEPKREQAAALLYTAPVDRLNDADVAGVLAPLGLDREAFSTCFSSPATQTAIDADMAMYERLAGRGLPLTYAGQRVVIGFNPERIEDAVRRETAGEQPSLPLPWLFAVLVNVAAVAVAFNARERAERAGAV